MDKDPTGLLRVFDIIERQQQQIVALQAKLESVPREDMTWAVSAIVTLTNIVLAGNTVAAHIHVPRQLYVDAGKRLNQWLIDTKPKEAAE